MFVAGDKYEIIVTPRIFYLMVEKGCEFDKLETEMKRQFAAWMKERKSGATT